MNLDESNRHVMLHSSLMDDVYIEHLDRLADLKPKKEGLLKPISLENISSNNNLKSIELDVS